MFKLFKLCTSYTLIEIRRCKCFLKATFIVFQMSSSIGNLRFDWFLAFLFLESFTFFHPKFTILNQNFFSELYSSTGVISLKFDWTMEFLSIVNVFHKLEIWNLNLFSLCFVRIGKGTSPSADLFKKNFGKMTICPTWESVIIF